MQTSAPYVSIVRAPSPPTVNLNDFVLRKGLRSRYKLSAINPNFFSTFTLTNYFEPGTLVVSTKGRMIWGLVVSTSDRGLCEIEHRDDLYHIPSADLRRASLLEVIAWESQ